MDPVTELDEIEEQALNDYSIEVIGDSMVFVVRINRGYVSEGWGQLDWDIVDWTINIERCSDYSDRGEHLYRVTASEPLPRRSVLSVAGNQIAKLHVHQQDFTDWQDALEAAVGLVMQLEAELFVKKLSDN